MEGPSGDFVLRVVDDGQLFEPDMAVEIFQAGDNVPGRRLEKSPHGPYRVVLCQPTFVNGTSWLDVTLRKIRRV